jgi:hypothetical protein
MKETAAVIRDSRILPELTVGRFVGTHEFFVRHFPLSCTHQSEESAQSLLSAKSREGTVGPMQVEQWKGALAKKACQGRKLVSGGNWCWFCFPGSGLRRERSRHRTLPDPYRTVAGTLTARTPTLGGIPLATASPPLAGA